MVCAGLETVVGNSSSIATVLAYPTSCDPQFYGKIMGALFIIITSILIANEKRDGIIKPDYMSALGVASIAVIFIALVGTLVGIITSEIFIEVLVLGMIFIVIWFFKK